MLPDHALTVGALGSAAAALVDLVVAIPPERWDEPGLGEWTVKETAAHALRALVLVDEYGSTARVGATPDFETPADYWRVVLAIPGGHAQVAARGRAGAASIGSDLPRHAREALDAATARLAAVGPLDVAAVAGGTMRWSAYLITRLIEIVVHGDDIARLTGASWDPGHEARSLAVSALAEFAPDAVLADLAAALLGRGDLRGVNLLA